MNWKQEAIEQLTKYEAMVASTKNLPEQIQQLEADVKSLRARSMEVVSAGKSSGPTDDRIINNIIKREQLKNSYENSISWVRVTDRAMSVLAPEEQTILEHMYIRPQKGVVSMLCESLGLEQSSVYRRRDQALYRFTVAMYGTS